MGSGPLWISLGILLGGTWKVLCALLDLLPTLEIRFYFKWWLGLGILWFRLSINSLLNPQRADTQGLHYGLSAQSARCTRTELPVACILLQAFPFY